MRRFLVALSLTVFCAVPAFAAAQDEDRSADSVQVDAITAPSFSYTADGSMPRHAHGGSGAWYAIEYQNCIRVCPALNVLVRGSFDLQKLNLDKICDVPGRLGLSLRDAEGRELFAINKDQKFATASISNLHIMYTLSRHAHRTRLHLLETMSIDRGIFEAYDGIYSPLRDRLMHEGATFPVTVTFAGLIRYAMAQSDSMAGQILLERVGGLEVVNRELGTNFRRLVSEMLADPSLYKDNTATPSDLTRVMFDFMHDPTVDESFRMSILKTMRFTPSGRKRIQKGVTQSVENLNGSFEVFDKTGTGRVYKGKRIAINDLAVVRINNGTYYLCVLLNDLPGKEPIEISEKRISDIARYIFDSLNMRDTRSDAARKSLPEALKQD